MDQFCESCEDVLLYGPICPCGSRTDAESKPYTTRVWFNKRKDLLKQDNSYKDPNTEGPKVEKHCQRCGTLTMQTYFTAQLRSADEGQTVFYRCTKCLIQTSENS